MSTTTKTYTVRVMWDGMLLEDDKTFDSVILADAYYMSTIAKYRRSDMSEGVTVQAFDSDGDVTAERTLS